MSISRRPLQEVLAEAESALRRGDAFAARTWATGFSPLDEHLGEGLRAGELCLLGGPQGLGKTTFALQLARNVATRGERVCYLSFEHHDREILQRLLAMEAGLIGGDDALGLTEVRSALAHRDPGSGGLAERLGDARFGATAVKTLADYSDCFDIVVGTADVDLTTLAELACAAGNNQSLLVVDYLQKVAVPGVDDEGERVTQIVESIKDLALQHRIPVLAVVAADREGISTGRTRLHHLRGSSALAYEADVALLLNNKYDVVARQHLVYDSAAADRFRRFVVCSIAKNRSGMDQVELQFRKRFEHGCFDPEGSVVTEKLLDHRVVGDRPL